MVLIFSAEANTSPQILREVERAVSRNIPIVPFKIDLTMPSGSFEYFLMVPHWLDASTPPLHPHMAPLVPHACGDSSIESHCACSTEPVADAATPGRASLRHSPQGSVHGRRCARICRRRDLVGRVSS